MLPVLDIANYLSNPHDDEADEFVNTLRETCHGPGFFYLTGHGIDMQTIDSVLAVANRFFDLPDVEREALAIANSAGFRGYTLLKGNLLNRLFSLFLVIRVNSYRYLKKVWLQRLSSLT